MVDQLGAKLEHIRQVYIDSFPEKIQELNACWARISVVPTDIKPLEDLRMAIHKISGSSGSHGFDDIHLLAKSIEGKLVEAISNSSIWDEVKQAIENDIQELINLLGKF